MKYEELAAEMQEYLHKEKKKMVLRKMQSLQTERREERKPLDIETYVTWLNEYSLKNKSFYDDDAVYFKNDIEEEDAENLQRLNEFGNLIYQYMETHGISESASADGMRFFINIGDNGYEIGVEHGECVTTYCIRKERIADAILIDDIIEWQKSQLESQNKLIREKK